MRVNCREQIANPAEPVNGQDERRKCAAVDSPARLCCSVIKRATAQNAAALCHYSERGIFHDRTRKVSRTYPAYTRYLLQDRYSPRCHRRSPEHTELPLYQKQIQRFFELVLDIDKAGREPSRQVMRYYHFDQPDQPSDPALFPFRLLTTRFEPVDGDTCAPVLYANTVADMISFSLQTCVERNITVRRCKNCGRYFAQTGRVSAEYCDRTPLDGQSSCRAMGAFQQWTLKQADAPVFKVYRREYKRRFAWIKAGRISDSEFYAWSEQAREQKKKCDEGIITAEDFQRWLKES